MKIAYFTNQYPKISHTFIRREIVALEKIGFEVERFAVRGAPESLSDPEDERERSLTRVLLEGNKAHLGSALAEMATKRPRLFAKAVSLTKRLTRPSERGPALQYVYLAEACLLARWCQAAQVEHVHVHFGTNPTTVAMLAAELGGPSFSFTAHGPEEFDKPHLIHLREKIERARFVAGVSEFGRSQLLRQCDYSHWDKIHVVRCGVDNSYLTQPVAPFVETNRLVCVGRLCEQKGQVLLVEAAHRLAREGFDFQLVLVGDGEMRGDVERRARELGVSDRIEITGWASGDRVRAELVNSRALVLPSFAEGLPVVIMEALALGRPVLSTYVAGIPELVVPGESGWLVPAGSLEHLVASMKAVLLTSSDELIRMGRDGRARVEQAHDAEKNAAQLAALFEGSR